MLAGCNVPRSSLKLPPLSENSTAAIAATPQSWENAKLIQTLPGHSTGRMIGVRFLSFSADGQQLITGGIGGEQPNANGSYEGTIKRWNPETGVLLPSVPGVFDETTNAYNSVKLWNLKTGKLIRTLSQGKVADSASEALPTFSPDGRMLANGTYDGKIEVWRVAP
jgi:WD40 repeat protein